MKRLVVLEGDKAARRFALLYEGFVLGQRVSERRAAGFEDVRREAEILKQLHAASREMKSPVKDGPVPCLASGDPARELVGDRAVLVLRQPELELLRRYFEATPWTASHAIEVVDVADLLGAAQEVSDDVATDPKQADAPHVGSTVETTSPRPAQRRRAVN